MRKPSRNPDIISFCYLGVSLFGLCLLAMLTFNVPLSAMNFPWQRQLTGSIFGTICILGIIAGISPSRCSPMIHFKRSSSNRNKVSYRKNQKSGEEGAITFKGHHPTCGNFSSHILCLDNKAYCAGCTGLVAGATISLIGSSLYFFAGLNAGEASILIFWLGFAGVACGLLQYNLPNVNRGTVHLLVNVIFVLGAFLLLLGVDEITGNFALEFYLHMLMLYWIITRIMLSRLEHRKMCATCGLESCSSS